MYLLLSIKHGLPLLVGKLVFYLKPQVDQILEIIAEVCIWW